MNDNGYDDNSLNTIVFIKDQKIFIKSEVEICKLLVGFPRIFISANIIPKKINDYFYDKFSKNRYNLFGKKID